MKMTMACVRVSRCRSYLVAALMVNLVILLYLAFIQHTQSETGAEVKWASHQSLHNVQLSVNQAHISDESDVTVIIREYEEFDNDLVNSIVNIQKTFNKIPVVVIGDKTPYPPLQTEDIVKQRFQFVSLSGNIWHNMSSSRPEIFIKTKYVMIVPDSTSITDVTLFTQLVKILNNNSAKILAVPFKNSNTFCSPVVVNFKTWTLEYQPSKPSDKSCNNVLGDHAVFMKTDSYFQFSQPYMRPLPLSLYIQGAVKHWTAAVVKTVNLTTLTNLYQTDPRHRWQHKRNYQERQEHMYRQLGFKLVIQDSGRRQWYGCTKDTTRCFDTVINDMPEYLYDNRWTPPCCLRALRETAKHVFSILDACEARFWLEGGSLLGAARMGDIIPWDYDVDVGIYREDLNKCDYLRQCMQGSYVDESGFVWEKAIEGDFYRVQYSETNRLHVDIFPFHSRNGTMTKYTWLKSHRQDTEFPEHFLKPLSKINFAGLEVKAPNDVKGFLEFKFGPGVIENPKYPNSQDPV
ncbi:ribitol 5-phosphate transferase FKRP-like [Haliotis cracherodii]|uniref:ribitol 5-phosphate transferase FKRP-like n=1 Tax=Haliotis cracherodii TaxID=6455 RepID=UPI0039E9683A